MTRLMAVQDREEWICFSVDFELLPNKWARKVFVDGDSLNESLEMKRAGGPSPDNRPLINFRNRRRDGLTAAFNVMLFGGTTLEACTPGGR